MRYDAHDYQPDGDSYVKTCCSSNTVATVVWNNCYAENKSAVAHSNELIWTFNMDVGHNTMGKAVHILIDSGSTLISLNQLQQCKQASMCKELLTSVLWLCMQLELATHTHCTSCKLMERTKQQRTALSSISCLERQRFPACNKEWDFTLT